MEFNQETNEKNEQGANDDVSEENSNEASTKQWLQDNLRVLVSILIVVIIAVGIYSYSNRSQAPAPKDQTEQSDLLKDNTGGDNGAATATQDNTSKTTTDKTTTTTNTDKKTASVAATSSQETDGSFIETAGMGDSTTKLARKALANYLEKNTDSTLTPEHKIYIEDFLRKNVAHKGGVRVGTSVEFSKSLIGDAIAKSKNLSAGQLKNLHKYALRVPSLT